MELVRKRVDKISITHNKKLLIVIIVLIILLAVLIYFILKNNNQDNIPIIEKECEFDGDCLKSSCCHAESCVPKEKSPNCDKVFCSQVCSGPLDCGAGHCGCVNNKCKVVADK